MDETPAAGAESWSGVATSPNETDAAVVLGFLESQGIPARLVDRSFHEMPTSGDDLQGFEIAVPASRLAEAKGLLDSRSEEMPAGSAEGTVMTDEGPAEISMDSTDSTEVETPETGR